MQPVGSAYPVELTIDAPLEMPRWRALFSILAAIPHIIVLYALNLLAGIMAFISWFAIVFTGKHPPGIAGVQHMCMRYSVRTATYIGFVAPAYPPFTFGTVAADPGDFPGVRLDFAPELEDRNRVTVIFRLFMVIPHVLVLLILGLASAVVYIVALFAVLITGRWPEGMRAFVIKVYRWGVRVQGYYYLLTDEYPPFELT